MQYFGGSSSFGPHTAFIITHSLYQSTRHCNFDLQRPLSLPLVHRTIAPLDRLGWLASQPEDLRDWVASVGIWRDYRSGQIIYMAHDAADGLYGLARGALDISSPDSGDEQVALSRAEPGFWIGDAALLSATPMADPERRKERIVLKGELPSPLSPPPGCAFNPRCSLVMDQCRSARPDLEGKAGRGVACFAVSAS